MKKISIGTWQSRGDLDTAEPFSRAQEIYSVRVVYFSRKGKPCLFPKDPHQQLGPHQI